MTDLTPGFTDPHAAQRCFRAILDAMSHPGRIVTLDIALDPPESLSPAAAACLLTLTDGMTRVAVPDSAAPWLIFHTGARMAAPADADFTVAHHVPSLADLPAGTDEAPEDGATLIIDLPALEAGHPVRLAGPGLEGALSTTLPLDPIFIAQWRLQSERAPRGVDLILCAGHRLLALPRSITIEAL
jgi:alpha-D-ribose 1-methylphosphonate 5-triphosphate synthase subunit PhnH